MRATSRSRSRSRAGRGSRSRTLGSPASARRWRASSSVASCLPSFPISVVVAGHPPPLRVHAGGVEAVGRTGPLLGAPDEPRWEVTTVELAKGQQLVLYTDGVTEARGKRDRFGEERLRATLATVGDPGTA